MLIIDDFSALALSNEYLSKKFLAVDKTNEAAQYYCLHKNVNGKYFGCFWLQQFK